MPTFVVDGNNIITHWNKACEMFTGVAAAQVVGTTRHLAAFYRNTRPPLSQQLLEKASGQNAAVCQASALLGGACEAEFLFQPTGAEGRRMYGTAALLHHTDGQVIGAIESWQDLTEYKRMETQLLQAQKMEAIGTLAGGIAHDFSNMLTAIMAHAEMARRHVTADSQSGASIQKVLEVCDHARKLIRRIMTFSRQTEVEIKPVRIDQLVNEAIDLIRATLPSSIQIVRELQCTALVSVDTTQIHQVLMNLCANAAHAMGGRRGTLTIRLALVDDQGVGSLPDDVEAGRRPFVKLSVADTGHGIPDEIKDRIFDPFFSTKKRDEGTGMGLAVSHGIVKRFGGAIVVDSRLGQGATFNVFLPVIQGPDELAPFAIESMPKGKERLLVVGASAGSLGDLLHKLEELGYRLAVHNSAEEAAAVLKHDPGQFDLLLVARPLASSVLEALIQNVRAIQPWMPIVLSVGYGVDLEPTLTDRLGVQASIKEPIILRELAELLRRLLDANGK